MITRVNQFRGVNLVLLIPAAVSFAVVWRFDFLWLEALSLAVLATAGAILGKRLGWTARVPGWCGPLRRASRNGPIACLIPALLSAILRTALLPWIPIPHPVVPDEHSHILLAKTFLLGRLANPPHPLWQHFESINIIPQPTYSSMYMAGQACFLAVGKLLAGDLFWGVILSTALFCAALTWFLRAYVPPGWAMFGGILAAVRIGAASYWNDSYWGGSAGALGGALVLGAYPRLVRGWRTGPSIALSSGLVLLANTRPYEGAILGAVIVAALILRVLHDGRTMPWRRFAASSAAAVIVLGISGWAMTRHWKAVTGNPFTIPYQVNQRMYGWPMTLPWFHPSAVQYRHPEFALYRDFEIREHRFITEPKEIPFGLLVKYAFSWRFYVGVGLSCVFLFANKILSTRKMLVPWIAGGSVMTAVITEQSSYPHYFSPAAPVFFLFFIQGLRYAAQCRIAGAPIGAALRWVIIPAWCIVLTAWAESFSQQIPAGAELLPNYLSWCCVEARQRDRSPVEKRLMSMPGKHLAIVSYELKDYDTFEWVYNEPDIDHAKVVWARDMGPEKNKELLHYFADRDVWQVHVTKGQTTLAHSEK